MVRIIIIDDDKDARVLLRIHLGRLGRYEVVGEAGDVPEGMELAARVVPDVVVLDELLPGGPGHAAIPGLRDVLPRARIVVWSSYPDRREEALAAGADTFIDKMDGPALVVTALDRLIPPDDE